MVVDFGDKGGTWDVDAGVMEFKRPEEGATCVGAAVDEEDVVFIEPEEGVVGALFFGSDGAAALKHCSKMFISMNADAKNPGVFNEEDCCWDAVAALIFDASQELYFALFSHDKVSPLTPSRKYWHGFRSSKRTRSTF